VEKPSDTFARGSDGEQVRKDYWKNVAFGQRCNRRVRARSGGFVRSGLSEHVPYADIVHNHFGDGGTDGT
jgi:hypothetical protein